MSKADLTENWFLRLSFYSIVYMVYRWPQMVRIAKQELLILCARIGYNP